MHVGQVLWLGHRLAQPKIWPSQKVEKIGPAIIGPAKIGTVKFWPSHKWSSQILAQPKVRKNWPSQILAAGLVLGFSPTLI